MTPCTNITVSGHTVYVATDGGLGVIHYEPYTMAKKAAFFEREMEDWNFKRLGFVHGSWSGQNGWLREISDNDGGHTAHYLAAMALEVAATGDEQARAEAVEAFKAMAWLDDITGKPEFIARSIWSVKSGRRASARATALADCRPNGASHRRRPVDLEGRHTSTTVNSHFYAVSLFP